MRAGIITTPYLWGRTAVERRDMLPCAASALTLLVRQLEVIRTILFVSWQRKPARVSICLSQLCSESQNSAILTSPMVKMIDGCMSLPGSGNCQAITVSMLLAGR